MIVSDTLHWTHRHVGAEVQKPTLGHVLLSKNVRGMRNTVITVVKSAGDYFLFVPANPKHSSASCETVRPLTTVDCRSHFRP